MWNECGKVTGGKAVGVPEQEVHAADRPKADSCSPMSSSRKEI